MTNHSGPDSVEGRTGQLRVRRAGPRSPGDVAGERILLLDVCGETLIALPVGAALVAASRIVDVLGEIADSHPTVQSMLTVPAVTTADLATVYELGRLAGRASTGPTRPLS